NKLATETSPYLLQHAHNPVDWYPWEEEALAKAKAEDKPIFLSIGYSACHWCHVMAHESFENPELAAIMNEHFVNVKVDREERPDLDAIYMDAVVSMTGHGGWPMSVFLTPDGIPFYGGTYFPPVRRGGMPSFTDVLLGVQDAWLNRREAVTGGGKEIVDHIQRSDLATAMGNDELSEETLLGAVKGLWSTFDWRHAGWGAAPKFPQPMTIEFLLRHHHRTGDALALEMVTKTLDSMLKGGMYDQLGGGFHRYSTDAVWLVPHFEKMLYDNSQLARAYLHAWLVTRQPEYKQVVEEILDYVLREMTDASGGFYSTQDADSEGEEGKFFVWDEAEVDLVLGEDAPLFKAMYGVTQGGNFEGKSILSIVGDVETLARKFNLSSRSQETSESALSGSPTSPDVGRSQAHSASLRGDKTSESVSTVEDKLAVARRKLFAVREKRIRPGLDDKVLSGWNGLMLAAFAESARHLGRANYRAAAVVTDVDAPLSHAASVARELGIPAVVGCNDATMRLKTGYHFPSPHPRLQRLPKLLNLRHWRAAGEVFAHVSGRFTVQLPAIVEQWNGCIRAAHGGHLKRPELLPGHAQHRLRIVRVHTANNRDLSRVAEGVGEGCEPLGEACRVAGQNRLYLPQHLFDDVGIARLAGERCQFEQHARRQRVARRCRIILHALRTKNERLVIVAGVEEAAARVGEVGDHRLDQFARGGEPARLKRRFVQGEHPLSHVCIIFEIAVEFCLAFAPRTIQAAGRGAHLAQNEFG
ncbi:MAG TPA: DUF255 domain-containing protein, partial [Anaerolineales bacterium]|nr:DUF255 domain-containing protein [Anaerolineales bacterium]